MMTTRIHSLAWHKYSFKAGHTQDTFSGKQMATKCPNTIKKKKKNERLHRRPQTSHKKWTALRVDTKGVLCVASLSKNQKDNLDSQNTLRHQNNI